MRPVSQIFQRVHKIQILNPHDKMNHISARAAAKAVKQLLVRRNGQRRGFFVIVQRTERRIPGSHPLELRVFRYDLHNIVPFQNLVNEILKIL